MFSVFLLIHFNIHYLSKTLLTFTNISSLENLCIISVSISIILLGRKLKYREIKELYSLKNNKGQILDSNLDIRVLESFFFFFLNIGL